MRGNVFRQCWCREPGTRKLLRANCPDLKKKGHGSWYARYDAARAAGEKRRQPVIGPFQTRAIAEAELARVLAKQGDGHAAPDRTVLVGAYLDLWLAGKARIRASTLKSYQEAIDLYWRPALGHLRLVELRDHHIAEAVAEIQKLNRPQAGPPSEMLRRLGAARSVRADGRKSTVPLSAARVKRVFAPLQAALNSAVPSRIPLNPCDTVELPDTRKIKPLPWTPERVEAFRSAYAGRLRISAARWQQDRIRIWASPELRPHPVMVWLAPDAGKFLDAIADDPFYALFHLAALSGMRRSELAALPWPEVQLGEGVLRVRDSKTETGVRDVFMDEETVAVLKAWRKRQAEARLALGKDWPDTGLVFTRDDGTPVPPQWMSVRFETLAYQAGMPPVRFHDLRHLAASLGLASGSDMKVVAEQLGHARSDFTRDYYSVVSPAQAKAAAAAAAAMIPRSRHVAPER
jgi:integrase